MIYLIKSSNVSEVSVSLVMTVVVLMSCAVADLPGWMVVTSAMPSITAHTVVVM